jgi:hypothetical protein
MTLAGVIVSGRRGMTALGELTMVTMAYFVPGVASSILMVGTSVSVDFSPESRSCPGGGGAISNMGAAGVLVVGGGVVAAGAVVVVVVVAGRATVVVLLFGTALKPGITSC